MDARQRRRDADVQIHGAAPGVYIEFEAIPDWELAINSLELKTKNPKNRIEVVAVTYEPQVPGSQADAGTKSGSATDEGIGCAVPRHTSAAKKRDEIAPSNALVVDSDSCSLKTSRPIQRATVFVPEGRISHFVKRLESYAKTTPKKYRERRYEDVFDRIASVRLATLMALWTDSLEVFPDDGEKIWWEVWLRKHDGNELARLMEYASLQGCKVSPRRLEFEDRIVTLVLARPAQLATSLDVLNDIAELRLAKETATTFADMPAEEQGDWAKDLMARTSSPASDAPAVCVLDTGVTQGHPLLQSALDQNDCHTCDQSWEKHDHDGHGTEMAGLALFGDLTPLLAGSTPVSLRHRLESVKILPPSGSNQPELYGALTAEATSRVEVQEPWRRRCFSMSIAATDERDRGQPTSWSAAIDALAAGRSFDVSRQGLVYLDDGSAPARRLFIICAGNVDEGALAAAHLDRSDADTIHDPAQAWNALTVGAFTDKANIQDPTWSAWQPLAPPGELSPWSTTSVGFADPWPLKPDVVYEGGNIVKNAKDEIDFPCPDLCLLSTHYKPAQKLFTLSSATSAATAQVARIAATIGAEYPTLWPEAIRALVVHSAEWTPQMLTHISGDRSKRTKTRLVRRYGFGVPSLKRALRSANDALTLIVQGSVSPFADGKMREMHFYDLPWPRDTLLSLGEAPARLKVTLSYFVEPNPARRGWKKRYCYPSHSLRFGLRGPNETVDQFRKRLNKRALGENEKKPSTGGDSSEWNLGEARNHGSIHSDTMESYAAVLALRGGVAVYPVGGWWKDQPKRDRSEMGVRYALVVSIETEGVETDIWTPVAQQIKVPITIEI